MHDTFGQAVEYYRAEVGRQTGKRLTIEALADACGVSSGTIKNCLTDKNKTGPKDELVDALARVFAARLSWDEEARAAFVAAGKRPLRPSRTGCGRTMSLTMDPARGGARRLSTGPRSGRV